MFLQSWFATTLLLFFHAQFQNADCAAFRQCITRARTAENKKKIIFFRRSGSAQACALFTFLFFANFFCKNVTCLKKWNCISVLKTGSNSSVMGPWSSKIKCQEHCSLLRAVLSVCFFTFWAETWSMAETLTAENTECSAIKFSCWKSSLSVNLKMECYSAF